MLEEHDFFDLNSFQRELPCKVRKIFTLYLLGNTKYLKEKRMLDSLSDIDLILKFLKDFVQHSSSYSIK